MTLEKTKTKKTTFRLQTKTLFLTYPKINQNLTKELILQQFKNKFKNNVVKNYLIAIEAHADGKIHCHSILILLKRCDIKTSKFLNLTWENKPYHGNYQSCKKLAQSISYLIKDQNYITNFELNNEGRLLTLEEKLPYMVETKGLDFTLNYIQTQHKEKIVTKYIPWKRALTEFAKDLIAKKQKQSNYVIDEYISHIEIDEALENNKNYSIWVSGPSATRKTSYITAKADDMRKQKIIKDYIYIRHLDQLKQFNPEKHELIIIDDCPLPSRKESLISLFEAETDVAVDVKYDVITIPAYVKRIYISNQTFDEFLKERNLQDEIPLIRRVKRITIESKIKLKLEVIENLPLPS